MKSARDVAHEQPQAGQGVFLFDRSVLTFSDFAVVLSSDSSPSFVSSYYLVPHIDDLQHLLCTKLGFAIGSVNIEQLFSIMHEEYFPSYGITSSGTMRFGVSDYTSQNSVVFMAQ